MRIVRVIAILIVASLAGIIIHSCCHGYSYKWIYIIAENFEVDHNTREKTVIADSISKEYYGIKVRMFERKYACNIANPFMNDLYAAYDCWPIYFMEDSIMALNIVTMNKFNALKDKGADVSSSFLCTSVGYYEDGGVPIDQSLTIINSDDMSVLEDIFLVLHDNSIIDSVHQFVVQVLLSDDRILSDTTEAVKLY